MEFHIRYEPFERDYGWLHFIADGKELTHYVYHNENYFSLCRKQSLKHWFEKNLMYIINDDPYPVDVDSESGVQWWQSCKTISANMDIDQSFDLLEKCQIWLWRHGIYAFKDEFYMPFVVLRRVHDQIEISWDNDVIKYENIKFVHNKGISFVPIDRFKRTVNDLLFKGG